MASGLFLIFLLLIASLAGSQTANPKVSPAEAGALVRRMAANEVAAARQPGYFRFRWRRETERGVFTGERIFTRQGAVSRTMAINGKALSPEQRQQWEQNAQRLIADPELQERRRKTLEEEQERILKMMRALPDAFLYESEGQEQDSGWLRLKFRPNPRFQPASNETRAFRGMEGRLWVDPASERLAKFHGVLVDNVGFGWGILGKLYRGGQVVMENTRVADGNWRTTALTLQLKGRIFVFKSFSADRKDHFSEFERLGEDYTLAQAVEHLRKLELVSCSAKRSPEAFCAAE